LGLVGLGVGLDLLPAQGRPGGFLAGGIADQPGEIADQEDDRMPQLLELGHLPDQHPVAQVQVGRGGVEPRLDAQRPPRTQPGQQEFLGVTGDRALQEQIEGVRGRSVDHKSIFA